MDYSVTVTFSRLPFFLGGRSCLERCPLRGDCNTGQWETHLQMRNKEVCFAYQLLTIRRVAFGCGLWFCRSLPSYGSRVMDPCPRNNNVILTGAFAWPLKTAASSRWHICFCMNRDHLTTSEAWVKVIWALQETWKFHDIIQHSSNDVCYWLIIEEQWFRFN